MVDVDGVVIDGMSITGDASTGSGVTVQLEASNVTISNNVISGIFLLLVEVIPHLFHMVFYVGVIQFLLIHQPILILLIII